MRNSAICGNCKWGKFHMTSGKNPRQRSDQLGECLWPIPELPVMPICVDFSLPRKRYGVWTDGYECPCWEVRDAR